MAYTMEYLPFENSRDRKPKPICRDLGTLNLDGIEFKVQIEESVVNGYLSLIMTTDTDILLTDRIECGSVSSDNDCSKYDFCNTAIESIKIRNTSTDITPLDFYRNIIVLNNKVYFRCLILNNSKNKIYVAIEFKTINEFLIPNNFQVGLVDQCIVKL